MTCPLRSTPPFRRRAARIALALLLTAPALCGCDYFYGQTIDGKKIDLACPKIGILRDANQLTLYRPGGNGPADVQLRAQIVDYQGTCTYDETGVTIDVGLIVVAERGPALSGNSVPLSYFAATIDPNGKAIARKQFDTTADFSGLVPRAGASEMLQAHVPLEKGKDARFYQLWVGFLLSRDQLDANRKANDAR